MRAIPAELQARLDGGATRICRCWKVERGDGAVFGFTDHDVDVTFGGVVFRASSGMDASALQTATGLSVDNAQTVGALTAAGISEEDIRAGRFDKAEIHHWLVDWERPDLRVLMFRGHFGEIRRTDGAFEVELRGLAEALNGPVGRSILRSCDRVLGDSRCRVDLGQPELRGEAEAGPGSSGTSVESGLTGFAEGWFAGGVLTWLTGGNAGEAAAVKSDRLVPGGRRLELWREPGATVTEGDAFRVVAGCDKRAETCRKKFDNLLNFRGFPHIPGDDWVTAYPRDGAVHDGGSQQ
jgi:uncharacterized phage protein (TIGR02218 family)